ncbi:MAG: hypothetical protein IKS42_05375 [Oscillospiraceae bacterium]|nr:hypothetical protein [Oscillospiraceae bacterium]
MKKSDVKHMIDGISETYIEEAVTRAVADEQAPEIAAETEPITMTGSAEGKVSRQPVRDTGIDSSTPFFMTKRAILALTAIAAVTVFAVGMVLREAFPKDHVRPGESGESLPSAETSGAESSEVISNDSIPGDNIFGGKGELKPVGSAGTNLDNLVLHDDTRFYFRRTGNATYLYCDMPEGFDSNVRVDMIAEQTLQLKEAPVQPGGNLFSDGASLYIEHDQALWKLNGKAETKLADYAAAEPSEGVYVKGFRADSVHAVNDRITYVIGEIGGQNTVFAADSETGTVTRMFADTAAASDEASDRITAQDRQPSIISDLNFDFSDGCVWYINTDGKLACLDYRYDCSNPGFVLRDVPADKNDYMYPDMQYRRWFMYGRDFYFTHLNEPNTKYDDVSDPVYDLIVFHTDAEFQESKASARVFYNLQQFYCCGDRLYTVELHPGDSSVQLGGYYQGKQGVAALSWYTMPDLTADGYAVGDAWQEHGVTTEYTYAVSPQAQYIQPIRFCNANEEYTVYYSNGAAHITNGSYSFAVTEQPVSTQPEIEVFGGNMSQSGGVIRLYHDKLATGKTMQFSARYTVCYANGEELPRNEAEYPPTAKYFPQLPAESDTMYPYPHYGPAYLWLDWEAWYGKLAPGDYLIRVQVSDAETGEQKTLELPITLDANGQYEQIELPAETTIAPAETTLPAVDITGITSETTSSHAAQYEPSEFPHGAADLTASVKRGTLTKSGCTVMIENRDTEFSGTYGVGYQLFHMDEGYEGVPCDTNGSEMSFIEIAYEMPPDTTAELEINWEEFYGKLEPGAYYIELWAKDKDGNPLRVDFVIT